MHAFSFLAGIRCRPGASIATAAAWFFALNATPFAFAEPARPAGVALVSPEVSAFRPAIWVEDKTTARIETVAVEGRPFAEALRLTTLKPAAQAWQIGASVPTAAPIRKGDVLWGTFQSRRIRSLQETGEAIAEVVLMQKTPGGEEVRPLERGFSCGPEWIETSIPFVAGQDSAAGAAALSIRSGAAIQSLEIGGVALINCGPGVDFATLPRTVTRYEGHAADAPWRAAAAARIERIRKGDLALRVVDAAGNPVVGAEVAVRMRRHAFTWGTEVGAARLARGDSPDAVRYRETVEKYFNQVVFGNDLKWGPWSERGAAGRQTILDALAWSDAREISVRGHVMVWPSWQHVPSSLRALEKDPAALRQAVSAHIAEQTALYRDRLEEWDVINETYAHNDLVKILGRDVLVDWIREAHAGAPNARLFYNDYVMFHGGAAGSPSQYLHDLIRFLREQGAPLGGIGEQGHFGGNPPGPAQIIAALDRFGEFGLPIVITEFDIDTPDEQLQADFTRDFTTAIFSHPAVTGMVQWGFWEGAHGRPSAALWRRDWSPRPGGKAWVDLVSKTWWTNADGRTGEDGAYATRGFLGDYEVTVSAGGRSETVALKLRPGDGADARTVVLR